MKKIIPGLLLSVLIPAAGSLTASAQDVRNDADLPQIKENLLYADPSATVLSLDDVLRIALNENTAVKVADKEIERSEYSKKGTYASLFPTVDLVGSYQRTIKKQVMYMDFDMSKFSSLIPGGDGSSASGGSGSSASGGDDSSASSGSNGGMEIGRWNTWSGGLSASMPLVNAQLWKSLKISGEGVELAVEKARSSRLQMVSQVKQAFYSVLLAKDAYVVYKDVYDNAVQNYKQTEMKYNAQRASQLEYLRAKSNVANAIPNVYNAASSVDLSLWQLKAVMGVDLDMNIDVAGSLREFADHMFYDIHQNDSLDLSDNSTMRQFEIQTRQAQDNLKLQKYAYIPSLAANFAYQEIAMENNYSFKDYKWSPYSYVGLSLSIPIFSGGKRLNDVRSAKAQAEEIDMQRIDTQRQLAISAKQSLNTMETSMNSYNSAVTAVGLAQKAYDISEKSYNVGRSTITDLNDAQLSLTQARLSESQAIYNFLIAKTGLEQTLGIGFLDEEGKVDLDAGVSSIK